MFEPGSASLKKGSQNNLIIRVYGTKEATYQLYDDDGESFDYEKGAFSWREIRVTTGKNGKLEGSVAKAERSKPDNFGSIKFNFRSE